MGPLDRLERFLVGAVAYLGLSALWLYGVVDRGMIEGSEWLSWSVIAGVAAAHVLFGFAIREWVALLLPIVVVFLAIPAGYPESQFGEPALVWLGQVFLVIVEIPLIAAGLGLRALVGGRRAARGTS